MKELLEEYAVASGIGGGSIVLVGTILWTVRSAVCELGKACAWAFRKPGW